MDHEVITASTTILTTSPWTSNVAILSQVCAALFKLVEAIAISTLVQSKMKRLVPTAKTMTKVDCHQTMPCSYGWIAVRCSAIFTLLCCLISIAHGRNVSASSLVDMLSARFKVDGATPQEQGMDARCYGT
jgi:hypothetical protein